MSGIVYPVNDHFIAYLRSGWAMVRFCGEFQSAIDALDHLRSRGCQTIKLAGE